MTSIKKLFPIISLVLAFGFGYYVRDLQQSKTALKQERTERKIIDKKIEISRTNAKELEHELTQVKQHEQNIISTALQTKKMDRNNTDCNCIDDDFVELFNNQNRIYERILSGEHVTALPDTVTRP